MFGLFEIFSGTTEGKIKDAWNNGYKAGYEQGVLDGMAKNFEKSSELTEEEYNEVIKFLVDRGLELCCYDVYRGGFRIRKRIEP